MYRRLWGKLLQWRFRMFHSHRHRELVLEHVLGFPLVVLPDVFNPAIFRTSAFLAQQIEKIIPANSNVLDMGTGTGIGAIVAASHGHDITALDITPAAVRCTQINVLLNHMESKIRVCESDLFAAIGDEQFDVVLFNPPYYRGQPEDDFDHAWRSANVIERFAAALPTHLHPNGFAMIVLSTDGEQTAFLEAFRRNKLCVESIAERDLINEILTVYRIEKEVV